MNLPMSDESFSPSQPATLVELCFILLLCATDDKKTILHENEIAIYDAGKINTVEIRPE